MSQLSTMKSFLKSSGPSFLVKIDAQAAVKVTGYFRDPLLFFFFFFWGALTFLDGSSETYTDSQQCFEMYRSFQRRCSLNSRTFLETYHSGSLEILDHS